VSDREDPHRAATDLSFAPRPRRRPTVRTVRIPLLAATTVLWAACARHAQHPALTPSPTAAHDNDTHGASAAQDTSAMAASASTGRDTTAADTMVTHNDVTEQALRVFGDSTGSAPDTHGLDSAAATAVAAEPTWDIDVRSYATQRRVEYFVARFSGDARDRFTTWVEHGTRYEPLIRAKLRAAGLPEDMAYLPIIESGYAPNAYSRAAAVGLWQLMTSTAQGAGLRVDWWVDERRDPVRSTDAAIRFLRYLKDQFGSIYLAAAAYDGGPGRISRGLARYADDFEGTSGDDLFFALADKKYLRVETKDYVPQLIAAALVAKEPTRYGLHIEPESPYVYDTVRVGPSTPLVAIAHAAGASLAAIADLNPHILRGVTPPRDSFTVRVPVGQAATFDSTFAALDSTERRAYTAVVTRHGDTWATLAGRTDVSTRELRIYNHGVTAAKSGRLPVAERVLVPSALVLKAAQDVPDPSIERYGGAQEIHIVRAGESLSRIAVHYHTTVATLMRLNGLRKSTILPGQALVISGSPRRRRHRS
jgi:membrane-bound lytic murein transglycosylase D